MDQSWGRWADLSSWSSIEKIFAWCLSRNVTAWYLFNTDLASTGGAAVNLPLLPCFVHPSVLHTPHLPISVFVNVIVVSGSIASAVVVAQLGQSYPHLLIFSWLTQKNKQDILKAFLFNCVLFTLKQVQLLWPRTIVQRQADKPSYFFLFFPLHQTKLTTKRNSRL